MYWLHVHLLMMKANDMRVFLLRWYDKFPEFKSRDLFLTGESYAGQHVVTFASVNIFLYLCYQVIDIAQLDQGTTYHSWPMYF